MTINKSVRIKKVNAPMRHHLRPNPTPNPIFALYLLGPVHLCLQTGRLIKGTSWANNLQKALFIYLTLDRDHATTSTEFQQQFWPHLSAADVEQEITAVSQNLTRILNLPNPIVWVEGGYQLHESISFWLDIDEFDKLLTQAAAEPGPAHELLLLQQAITLYRGDFLRKLPLNQEWITSWRTHFQQGHLAALQKLNALYEQVDSMESARMNYLDEIKAESISAENGRSFSYSAESNSSPTQTLRQCKRLISLLQNELEILLEECSHPLDEPDSSMDHVQEGRRG